MKSFQKKRYTTSALSKLGALAKSLTMGALDVIACELPFQIVEELVAALDSGGDSLRTITEKHSKYRRLIKMVAEYLIQLLEKQQKQCCFIYSIKDDRYVLSLFND